MEHKMRLHPKPFMMIKSGEKNIEYRLNDEKRQKIKINDTIVFFKRPKEQETISVIVTEINKYPDLLSMMKDNFEKDLNKIFNSPEEAEKNITYYKAEEIEKYGCIAIKFKII